MFASLGVRCNLAGAMALRSSLGEPTTLRRCVVSRQEASSSQLRFSFPVAYCQGGLY